MSEQLVSLRHRTLALAAFIDIDGTLPVDLIDAEPISGSTTFEQITCVGLTPSMDQLTAVVRIHAGSGYSGPLCAAGSTEHVRFFVSTDDGSTWTDAGTDSFAVHDTTGPRPLDHAVNVVAPMRHTLCWIENHPIVRAILSWNVTPPAGNPHWTPPWGNVVDVRVRPRGRRFPRLSDLIEVGAIKIPKDLAATLVLDSPVTLTQAPSPGVPELAKTYAEAKVPAHRFALPAYLAATQSGLPTPAVGAASDVKVSGGAFGAVLTEINLTGKDFLSGLFKTDGDTSYEELGCIGYDPVEDALVGVFTVKRSSGYSGGPCTAGSTEHVAFWVDWGSGWEHVGTTATTVHDEDVPDEGLHFAVYHPLGSYAHRRSCSDGPVQPRIRAVLSWQQAPPPGDPHWRPTWGNREETTIELPAGAVTPLSPVLESVSGHAVCQIDPSTGRTIVHQRPFGARVSIAGFIPGAPDRSSPPMKYRLVARQIDSGGAVLATETLRTNFSVWVTESVGGGAPTQHVVNQVADADGWFDYLDDTDPSGTGWRRVVGNLLYPWQSMPRTGLWEVELRAKDAGGTVYAAQVITCTDSTTRQQVRLHLDQAAPDADVEITSYRMPGQPAIPAGSCMKFPVGAILAGIFSATDEHFDSIGLAVEGTAFAATTPGGSPRWTLSGATAYPAAATSGTSGTWEFDTSGMPACGYVLRGTAVDRTVNGSGGWRDVDVEGFSLE
ncbi:MAG: hypothetical protein ABR500_16335 [Dermatophilaceae bacterium]|nr:hypothetical protein [Intrasporangiaceae bacterium]